MIWRWIWQGCALAVNLVTTLALLLCGSFGAYALWDNQQVLTQASDVQAELLQWKPKPAEEGEAPDYGESFRQLRRINPGVQAWITMEDTGIDHPVLQETAICVTSTGMCSEISPWREAFSWTAGMTRNSDRSTHCCTATTWPTEICSEIWKNTRRKPFFGKAPADS